MIKKIFFISRDANWQQYRLEVLTKLAEKHHYDVEILTTGKLKEHLQDNNFLHYKLFSSWLPLKWSLNFFPAALLHIIKEKPDYVLALPNASNLTEFIVLPLCKMLNIPIIYWTHGYDHGRRKSSFINNIRIRVIEFFLKHADHILAFSPKGKEYLISKDIEESKITIAPNTLNTDMWLQKNEEYNKLNIKKEKGYDEHSKVILFSGRLNEDKKVINLLKAMHHLQSSYSVDNLFLHIVGDGSEKKVLESYVNENKLKNITFHGYVFDEDEISKLFCMSDMFVMPGYIGLAIVHAFCFGLPVITEDLNYHSPEIQYLKNDINGYFIEEENIEELAEKILYLSSNNDKLNELSSESLKTAKQEASIQNMIDMMHTGLGKSEQ